MGQPVKVSDELILDARLCGKIEERSIAGQIEFWAKVGRAMEPLMRGDEAMALCKSGAARSLSDCIDGVDSPEGRRRLVKHLESLPFPHYEPAPEAPGFLVRIEADGRRTIGRFVNREFQPRKPVKKSPFHQKLVATR